MDASRGSRCALIIDDAATVRTRSPGFLYTLKMDDRRCFVPLDIASACRYITKLSVPCRIHRDLAHLRRHFRQGKQNAGRASCRPGKTTRFIRNFRNKSTTEMRKQFLSSNPLGRAERSIIGRAMAARFNYSA